MNSNRAMSNVSQTVSVSQPGQEKELVVQPRLENVLNQKHSTTIDTSSDDSQSRYRISVEVVFLAVIVILAAVLRVYHLSDVSLWYDEACSWRISQYPWTEMWSAIAHDAHPPLYYLMLRGWTAVWGNEPATLRALSIVFGLATVCATWGLVRSLSVKSQPSKFVNGTPLLAALLIAINPLQIEMSQEARPYTLGTFLAVLAASFLMRTTGPKASLVPWTGFGLCATGLSLTHYYGLWTVGALFLYATGLVIASRKDVKHRRTMFVGYALSLLIFLLCWLPWWSTFLFQHSRAVDQLWMKPLTVEAVLKTTFKAIAGGKHSDLRELLVGFAALGWVSIGLLMLASRRSADRLLGLCLLGPVVATVLYSLCVRNILGVRYLIFAQTFLLISVALLIGRIRSSALRFLSLFVVVGWSLFWTYELRQQREFSSRFPGAIETAAEINRVVGPDQPCIASSPFIFTLLFPYIGEDVSFAVRYSKDYEHDLLSGPSIRRSDFENVDSILQSQLQSRIWTIGATGLFGNHSQVRVPDAYEFISEKRFAERYGYRIDYVLREYKLREGFHE